LRQFHDIKSLVAFSPLLWFFDKCYHKKTLNRDGLIIVIKTLLSYQYRRLICKESTNALNKTYAVLPKEIGEVENIPAKLLDILAKKSRTQVFPRNDVFRANFTTFDVYTPKLAKYTLAMLENQLNSTEKVQLTEQITIEHIMPQNLSVIWKEELGKDYEQIHSQWLHTPGNLTLSGSNSEMGNDGYIEKKKVYINSNIALSRDAAKADIWNDKSIKERAERLANVALTIWSLPDEYNKAIDESTDLDHSQPYNIMDDIRITGVSPKSYIFGDEEKSVSSWVDMFVGILSSLHDFDRDTYEKFIAHDTARRKHLAEPKGTDYNFKRPVEICEGYLTETNYTSQTLMGFIQIAVELYGLEEDVWFTLKPKRKNHDDDCQQQIT
jgi:hypothetical protein